MVSRAVCRPARLPRLRVIAAGWLQGHGAIAGRAAGRLPPMAVAAAVHRQRRREQQSFRLPAAEDCLTIMQPATVFKLSASCCWLRAADKKKPKKGRPDISLPLT